MPRSRKTSIASTKTKLRGIRKCPTGIRGLDEITEGGLPRGRTTLVCGGAGSGKTLLAMEFIVRGILEQGEPGVFVSFEESTKDLTANVASLGFDLEDLSRRGYLALTQVQVERGQMVETGGYDLGALFLRIGNLIDKVKAKRVVLDTLEALFSGLSSEAVLRGELQRLFQWFSDRKITSLVTAEQGDGRITRYGLEEYVSDCVILLDHRLINQIATRRLRIVKYRGSAHRTNEYPTLIDEHGLSVLPLSSLSMSYPISKTRVSTGVKRIDTMIGGRGYYRGSSILVSGTAGTGKTSLAAAFVNGVCEGGRRSLYISFEESPGQLIRNMMSISINLERWVGKGLLQFRSQRVSMYSLEGHLVNLHSWVEELAPFAVVMDPITSLIQQGDSSEILAMLTRTIDYLKKRGITAFFTSLAKNGTVSETSDVNISSLMDTWLHLRNVESGGERTRELAVIKARGIAHSNQVREFILTDKGPNLRDVYVGQGVVLRGSAREVQESQDRERGIVEDQAFDKLQLELQAKQRALEGRIEAMRLRMKGLAGEMKASVARRRLMQTRRNQERRQMQITRKAD